MNIYSKIIIPYVLSSNLKLDFLSPLNAQELFNLIHKNRPYLEKFLSWVKDCQCIEDSQNFIHKTILDRANQKSFVLGIWHQNAIIGVISYIAFSDHLNGEIGYWISAEKQGQGMITKSCHELVKIGFSNFGLKSILIVCASNNIKSQTIAKRLGFDEIKTLEPSFPHINLHHKNYILTNEKWLNQCQLSR